MNARGNGRTWGAAWVGLTGAVVAGCSTQGHDDRKLDAGGQIDPIVRAQELWAATKASCGTYHYAVVDTSVFGSQATTTIEITGDHATARRYLAGRVFSPGGILSVSDGWVETTATIGTHVGIHAGARAAKTMEQLYADCAHDVLTQDPTTNQLMLQTSDDGVLQQCWYFPRNCADDCTNGVVVSSFACGSLAPSPPPGAMSCGGGSDPRAQVATIHVTGSTNSPPVDVAIYCDGSAARTLPEPAASNPFSIMPKMFAAGSAQVMAFLSDLDAIGDVSTIPISASCPKSVSFGTVTTVSALRFASGDLQCVDHPSPAQAALANDATILASEN